MLAQMLALVTKPPIHFQLKANGIIVTKLAPARTLYPVGETQASRKQCAAGLARPLTANHCLIHSPTDLRCGPHQDWREQQQFGTE